MLEVKLITTAKDVVNYGNGGSLKNQKEKIWRTWQTHGDAPQVECQNKVLNSKNIENNSGST